MCGFVGHIGPIPPSENQISLAKKAICHRGPDHQSVTQIILAPNLILTLVFARLAIIDKNSNSNQPFIDGDNLFAFNGEFYDYKKIKSNSGLSKVYTSRGDGEVLFKMLASSGFSALEDVEGMYAFFFLNRNESTFSLGRDFFGEKPIWKIQNSKNLWFGSEINSISKLSGVQIKPNIEMINRFLVNGYKSIFKDEKRFILDFKEIKPGTVETFNYDFEIKNIIVQNKWKTIKFINQSELYIENQIRKILVESLEKRILSDVPIAFCLSGGIDSSSLVAIAKRDLGKDVDTFSIITDDIRYNEEKNIDVVAKHLGVRNHKLKFTKEHALHELKDIINHRKYPLVTINYFLHSQLMREISKLGFKVSISGTGADEIFSGYYDHHLFFLKHLEDYKNNIFKLNLKNWQKEILPNVRNELLRDFSLFSGNEKFRQHLYDNSHEIESYIYNPSKHSFTEEKYHDENLRNRMLNEVFHEAVPVILREDDFNSMQFSVENRSPYLDKNLFQFMLTLESEHLIKNGFAKYQLRKATQNLLPEQIIWNNRKVGFNASVSEIFGLNHPHMREEILADSQIWDIVNRTKFKELIKRTVIENSLSKFIFSVISIRFFLDSLS